jgi:DnaJ-domain-containing protein 1
MPLVASVLEMLRTAFPSFEIDFDLESAGREPEPERREPEAHAHRRPRAERPRVERPRSRKASRPRPAEADPVLQRCYAHLGLSSEAGFEAVRSAWRRLVREHHPDLYTGHPDLQRQGSERVKELNRAYEEIKRRLARGR